MLRTLDGLQRMDVEELRAFWKSLSAAFSVICRWVGRSRLRWARKTGDDYYTRLAASVNSYAAPSHPNAEIQLPERRQQSAAWFAKRMDSAMSRRWAAGGNDVYGEHWLKGRNGQPLKATGQLVLKVMAARGEGPVRG